MSYGAFLSRLWGRLAWICPLLAIALAAWILAQWGVNPRTAVVAALLLACPVLLVWGALRIKRTSRRTPLR